MLMVSSVPPVRIIWYPFGANVSQQLFVQWRVHLINVHGAIISLSQSCWVVKMNYMSSLDSVVEYLWFSLGFLFDRKCPETTRKN